MPNYERGMKRAYAVVVIIWELICIGLFLILSAGKSAMLSHHDYPLLLGYMILPPLLIYVLGFIAVPWIVRGFKR